MIGSSHGSTRGCALLKQEAESAEFSLLPGTHSNISVEAKNGRKTVQPDLIVKTKSVYCVVEAKGLRRSSFQHRQLAREFRLAHTAEDKIPQQTPLLLLVLTRPPLVLIQGKGRQSLETAIMAGLREEISPEEMSGWQEKIRETVTWITWSDIDRIVQRNFNAMNIADRSVQASIKRLVQSISEFH
ncbi:MAG: hypothetical protein DME33_04055 [Verrucomicrobia bacterium]|nr:MAG: hypothetical protein DME33_04055 [Verrucomicrobiota bacterium]